MSRHRFFLTDALPHAAEGEAFVLPLSVGDLHHAGSVLRVRSGEEIDVVEPSGRVVRVTVEAVRADELLAHGATEIHLDSTPHPRLTLAFGVSKGSKNDEIVEGAVEVGVTELLPIITARCVVKLDAEKRQQRVERWSRVALAAAKQSKRSTVPHVDAVCAIHDALPLLAAHDVVLVAWEEADAACSGLRSVIARAMADANLAEATESRPVRVALVVGPEGGLTAEEVGALGAIGARTVTLGTTILRAETAAVVASALAIHELGGLGNSR